MTRFLDRDGELLCFGQMTEYPHIQAFKRQWNRHAGEHGVREIAWTQPVNPGENPLVPNR